MPLVPFGKVGLKKIGVRRVNARCAGIRLGRDHEPEPVYMTARQDDGTTSIRIAIHTGQSSTANNERLMTYDSSYPFASSFARCAAFTTALISVTRNLPSSSSMIPSMVHPAGVVTASFNKAG